MKVLDELPPPSRKPPLNWLEIRTQLRRNAGKWVQVGEGIARTTVSRINGAAGMPSALRNDPDYTYEAEGRDLKDNRVTLYVRATKRKDK